MAGGQENNVGGAPESGEHSGSCVGSWVGG